VLNQQQTAFNSRYIGKVMPVLFERAGRQAGQLVGRSPYQQAVHADGPFSMLGRILPVEISSAGPNSLSGIVQASLH
jgi:tRNA-2-methylthio-N6-dimethylallyladenosine synthase